MYRPMNCQVCLIPRCSIVPDIDLLKCFNVIRKKYNNLSRQDVVRSFLEVVCFRPESEKKILQKILLKNIKCSGATYHDSKFIYCYKNKNILTPFKGNWWTKDCTLRGGGLFSLVKAFRKNRPGIDDLDLDALNFVAETLGVKFSKSKVEQSQESVGLTFIPDPNLYGSNSHIRFDASYLLGVRDKEYIFHNANGSPSFKLLEWKSPNVPIQLFLTLYVDDKTGERLWEYMLPPNYEDMIFNRHLFDQNNNKEIHIHDEIARADYSKDEQVIATWSGDLSISSHLKWSFLEGRNVSYIFDKYNSNSIEIGYQLIKQFSKLEPPLKLCCIPNSFRYPDCYMIEVGQENTSPDRHDRFMRQIKNLCSSMDAHGDMTVEEFYNFAKYYHGLDDLRPQAIKNNVNDRTSAKKYDELDGDENQEEFLVEPLFEGGELVLITAKKKVGKSRFALDLCLMVAGGESMGKEKLISAPKPHKVLLLDAEMPEPKIKRRITELLENYENPKLIRENFECVSFRNHPKRLNLSTPDDQKLIESKIEKEHDFVVFDNLGKFLPPQVIKSDNLWEPVHTWFRTLTCDKRTVLLIHHKKKDGEMSGTGKIPDDVDLSLSLLETEYPPDRGKIRELYIDFARYLPDDETTFCFINYYKENNRTKLIVHKDDSNLKKQGKGLVPGEDISQRELTDAQQEVISRLALTKNQKDIAKEMLDPALHAENGYIKPGMFIAKPGTLIKEAEDRSKGTIDKIIGMLCEEDQLKTSPKCKGKYYLRLRPVGIKMPDSATPSIKLQAKTAL